MFDVSVVRHRGTLIGVGHCDRTSIKAPERSGSFGSSKLDVKAGFSSSNHDEQSQMQKELLLYVLSLLIAISPLLC